MAIPTVAVGGKVTATEINLLAAATNGIALNGLIPSSVAGTGVTMSPNGQVTFINTPAVTLNGVFTPTYDNYRITWNSTNRSSSSATQIRFRTAGTDTAATYSWLIDAASGTSVAVSSSTSGTYAPIDAGIAAGQLTVGAMDLFAPALSQPTVGIVKSTTVASNAVTQTDITICQQATTTFDGFTIAPVTGGATWSGILRVYGYNNLI